MATANRVAFVKADINLWAKHNPWLSESMIKDGVMLRFGNGEEILFQPTSDGRCLKPIKDATTKDGYQQWTKMPYGGLVEAEVLAEVEVL